jgi:DNA repair exonuclease SbcCD ATPase subunit
LSTLTKVLIVLLTLASIFLCGILVTYVANATDYKEKYDRQYSSYQAAERRADNAESNFNKLKSETDQAKLELNKRIAALEQRIGTLMADLKQCQIDRDDARRKEDTWEAMVKDFTERIKVNNQLTASAQAELKQVTADLTKERAEHVQTTDALQEARLKRLLEEKTELQSKLDQIYKQYGKITAPTEPVTAVGGPVQVAPPVKDIDLEGVISDLDLQERLAEISIGRADGVQEGMRFHVTRGDRFICDIVILDVQPEKATGWLELIQEGVQNQPRINDKVGTNL